MNHIIDTILTPSFFPKLALLMLIFLFIIITLTIVLQIRSMRNIVTVPTTLVMGIALLLLLGAIILFAIAIVIL